MSESDLRYERPRSEAPLTLERHDGPRERGPAPVTLIISLLLLAAVGGGVFYMYRGGVRGPGDAPEPLGVPLRDVREAAPPQPQSPDPTAGLTIARDDPNAVAGPPTLAPPPEQPAPINALPSRPAAAAGPVMSGNTSPPTPAAAGAGVMSSTVTPPALSPAAAAAASTDSGQKAAPSATIIASKSGPKSMAKSDASGKANVGAKAKADPIEGLLAQSAKSKTSATPEASGPAAVQIGAFSSAALADKEWGKAAALAPGAMAGKGKHVVPVTKDGGTLYRTSITGFSSREQALAFCAKLKAAGGSCFVR